jgi:outer membrane protein W
VFLRTTLTALTLTFLFTLPTYAASVTTVKGQKVLINLEGADSAPGDEFFLINPESQKKAAIIRVRQVKNGKAVADIVKGHAKVGFGLQAKGSSRMSAEPPPPEAEDSTATAAAVPSYDAGSSRDTGYLRVIKNSWGVLGAITMNTMNANISNTDVFGAVTKTSASMKGNGFGAGGFYDYAFTPDMVGHASAMLEQFTSSGSADTAACKGSTNCEVNITYLSLYALGKYYFTKDKFRMWGGGGMGYLSALSKSSTALNESKISANQVLTLAFGGDYQMSRKNYIPISIEYNYFWPSADVTANQIILKAGWAWNL